MKLYGSYNSPFVRHCRVALAQGNHDFEFIEADYAMSAEQSPTAKVPYFEDGGITLTDSSSILKYVREKSGLDFLKAVEDFELFAMTTTLLDTSINIFLLENDGFSEAEIPYVGRQKARVQSGLSALNRRINPADGINTDSSLRCACFIDWGLFRQRFSLEGLNNLQALLAAADKDPVFLDTAPPGHHG